MLISVLFSPFTRESAEFPKNKGSWIVPRKYKGWELYILHRDRDKNVYYVLALVSPQ